MDQLFEPFVKYSFMRNALIAALLVGTACSCLGAYVVQRRMAYMGDALSHATLPGVVIAFIFGFNMLAGAVLAGLITAIGIGWFSKRNIVREDSAIGIFSTGMFAIGLLLLSNIKSYRCLSHMIFGNLLGVSSDDLLLIFIMTAIIVTILFLFYKELELTSCDPVYALGIGLKPDTIRFLLLILLAFGVVGGIQSVGILLTSALLVIPAATAQIFCRDLKSIIIFSNIFTIFSIISGLLISYYYSVSSGASIVLVSVVVFILVWFGRSVFLTYLKNNLEKI